VPAALPSDDASRLTHLLFRQHNVISRRQALRVLSPDAIRHRVLSKRWTVVHRGVYLVGSSVATVGEEERRWIASLSSGAGRPAPLGGVSALTVLGLRGFGESDVHVVLPEKMRHRNPPTFAVVHRSNDLTRALVHWNALPPAVRVPRSVVDPARWAAHDDRARAIVAAAFQQRLVTGDDVEAALAALPKVRRRAVIREAIADARGGGQSLPEAQFLRLCRAGGLPRPTCQVRQVGTSGSHRYLDALFDEWQIHVEIDGAQHMDVRQWWADMKRQNDLWIPGNRVLRFPSWAVRHRPDDVAAQVRAALMAAGWRP
jgi:hypothetical protein